jgi:hypothetical protein
MAEPTCGPGDVTVHAGTPPPAPALSALILAGSPRAARVLPSAGLRVERLPFLVGRTRGKGERTPLEMNDLSLPDARPYNVSRNHCSLERRFDRLVVRDRGSLLGTIVNGVAIGRRQSSTTADLVPGENVVVVGSRRSPFQLRVVIDRGPDPA